MDPRSCAISLLFLAGCAPAPVVPEIAPAGIAVVLLGEQHDAPEHQALHRQTIERLVGRNTLAAVAIEMAEQGTSTAGLPRDAPETTVKTALRWNDRGWPWPAYGPAVMSAVRAGVPVLGANLPRSRMDAAMTDPRFDILLPPHVVQAQRKAVDEGHCGLLPQSRVGPMARIQIARDAAMAQTLVQAAVPGKIALLLAGAGHVDAAIGVPLHLPPQLRSRSTVWPPQAPAKDYCAQLRQDLKARPAP